MIHKYEYLILLVRINIVVLKVNILLMAYKRRNKWNLPINHEASNFLDSPFAKRSMATKNKDVTIDIDVDV